MEFVVIGLVVLFVWMAFRGQRGMPHGRARGRIQSRQTDARGSLEDVRRAAEEDVTRFGEELQRLDADVSMSMVDDAMRQDWQRALDDYAAAGRALELRGAGENLRHVTEALEDGRYAVACVLARRDGKPLPTRRPPCFFNPAHGPSTVDIEWAPPGGQPRQVPVCAADADRVAQGAEPAVRTVQVGAQRMPYWQAGPAFSPWAFGYFGGFAASGLLPGFLLGSMLATDWDGAPVDGFDTGQDGGYDGSGDAGGDASGYDGGDGGGYDAGGGFGGGDFGGGDFGGGDFGGF